MAGGRPSPIDRVIGQRDIDGTLVDVTVADRIIAGLRAGAFVEHAAASAGITKKTFYEWASVAGQARIRYANTLDLTTGLSPDMSDHERRCAQFCDAVEEARGVWAVGMNQLHERLARGDFVEKTTITKMGPDGKVIEVTERERPVIPDRAAIEWRMTRAAPHLYAPPERIEVTGADGAPLFDLTADERASSLTELAKKLRGAAGGKRGKAGRSKQGRADEPSAADTVAAVDAEPESAPPPSRGRSSTARTPKKQVVKKAQPTRAKQRRAARRKDDDD